MGNFTNEIHFVIAGKVVPKQGANFGQHRAYPKKGVREYAQRVKAAYLAEYPLKISFGSCCTVIRQRFLTLIIVRNLWSMVARE